MTTHAQALAASRNFLVQDDVALLHKLAQKLARRQEPLIVDVGCGAGTTSLAILEECERAHVYAFDTSPDAAYWAWVAVENAGYAERWEVRVMASLDAARELKATGLRFDLVLLDSSHLYEDTLAELHAWVPLLVSGGWVWLHDYEGDGGLPEGENGVKRAVDEYMRNYGRLFTTHLAQGLGIAYRRKEYTP